MKKLIVLASIIFLLASCKKESLPAAGGTTLDKIVVRNSTGAQIGVGYYTYNSNNQIIKITSWDANAPIGFDHFEYDGSGRLSKHTYETVAAGVIEYYTYQYDGQNRIIKATGTPVLPGLVVDDYSYSYDAQNRVIADSTYDTGALSGYTVYEYDSKGNVVKSERLNKTGIGFVSQGVVNIQYDDKVNPYKVAGNIYYYTSQNGFTNLSPNNLVQYIPDGGSVPIQYEYYSNGLVRTRKGSGLPDVAEYFYK